VESLYSDSMQMNGEEIIHAVLLSSRLIERVSNKKGSLFPNSLLSLSNVGLVIRY